MSREKPGSAHGIGEQKSRWVPQETKDLLVGLESRTPAGFPEKPRDHGIIWDHGHGIREQNSRRVPHPGMWNAGAILILTIPSSPPSSTTRVSGWAAPCTTTCPRRPTCGGAAEAATSAAGAGAGAASAATTAAT